MQTCDNPSDYVYKRLLHRIGGGAACFAILLPGFNRWLLPRVRRLPEPFFLFPIWMPTSRLHAALMGAGAGECDRIPIFLYRALFVCI